MISRTLCLLAIAGAALPAAAQTVGQIEPEPGADNTQPEIRPEDGPQIRPEIPTTATLFTAVLYNGASDTNGSAGELRTLRIPARFRYATPIDEKNILGIDVSQVSSFYDFQPFSEFPGSGDPLEYGLAANIGISLVHILNRDVSLIAAINGGFAGEINAEFEDSLTAGGMLGIRYSVNPNVRIGANLIVQTRFEEDLIAFPIPTLDWDFADYWNLKFGTLNQLPSAVTGGFALTHDLADNVDVGAFLGVSFREFRLADDNSSAPAGILEDAAVPIGTFVTYDHTPNITITGSVHGLAWREVNLRSRGGGNIADVELQPTLGASLGVQFKL